MHDNEDESEQARKAIFQAIDTQLADGDPPETAEALDRLLKQGYSRDDAYRLIGAAIADETKEIMKHGREFDRARFVGLLKKLPAMPWE